MIPPTLLALAPRIGWKGAAMIGLAGFGLVQTVRIEGALWIDGYKADLAACERDKAALVAAQAEAQERAVQARMAEQQRLQTLAEKADDELEEARRDALADARAYIERMRPESRLRGGGTVAASEDSDTGVTVPTDAAPIVDGELVLVAATDVLICTDNTVKLEVWQEWAAGLNVPE
jgi:hypothetical protein